MYLSKITLLYLFEKITSVAHGILLSLCVAGLTYLLKLATKVWFFNCQKKSLFKRQSANHPYTQNKKAFHEGRLFELNFNTTKTGLWAIPIYCFWQNTSE